MQRGRISIREHRWYRRSRNWSRKIANSAAIYMINPRRRRSPDSPSMSTLRLRMKVGSPAAIIRFLVVTLVNSTTMSHRKRSLTSVQYLCGPKGKSKRRRLPSRSSSAKQPQMISSSRRRCRTASRQCGWRKTRSILWSNCWTRSSKRHSSRESGAPLLWKVKIDPLPLSLLRRNRSLILRKPSWWLRPEISSLRIGRVYQLSSMTQSRFFCSKGRQLCVTRPTISKWRSLEVDFSRIRGAPFPSVYLSLPALYHGNQWLSCLVGRSLSMIIKTVLPVSYSWSLQLRIQVNNLRKVLAKWKAAPRSHSIT